MKIARYTADGETRLGVVEHEKIFPIDDVIPNLSPIELIERWPEIKEKLSKGAAAAAVNYSGVRFEAPVDRPGKILALGMNYADHVAEGGMAMPEHQVLQARQLRQWPVRFGTNSESFGGDRLRGGTGRRDRQEGATYLRIRGA
jgi:2-keto-4-pentenoate hydratase/2-oxohepta-3-ene-1,7-dioic acid hydratase in catechol pathway